jgi:hypothetical protein
LVEEEGLKPPTSIARALSLSYSSINWQGSLDLNQHIKALTLYILIELKPLVGQLGVAPGSSAIHTDTLKLSYRPMINENSYYLYHIMQIFNKKKHFIFKIFIKILVNYLNRSFSSKFRCSTPTNIAPRGAPSTPRFFIF